MLERNVLVGLLVVALVVIVPFGVGAQQQGPRDLIRLLDGGVLRGTIAEVAPGLGVVIVLPTGETRRVPAALIAWVGSDPVTPPPAAPALLGTVAHRSLAPAPAAFVPQSPTVPVRVEASEPGATLHRVTGQAVGTSSVWVSGHYGSATTSVSSFERICTAPCTVAAPVGSHELALSLPGHLPVTGDPITIDRGGVLRATYNSRSGLRAAGWALFAACLLGGAALTVASLEPPDDDGESTGSMDTTMALGGLGVMLLSIPVSFPLIFQRDSVDFHLDAR